MTWLTRLLRRHAALEAAALARLERWRALPATPPGDMPSATRFVVADVETTGLDVRRDRLIAIGAVTVEAGKIDLGRAFYTVLRQAEASSRENILIHGIGGTTQRAGEAPVESLLAFLEFAGHAPLVGYHAAFDAALIGRAMREHLGCEIRLPWVDLAVVAPERLPGGNGRDRGLDAWLDRFGIEVFNRHDAVADALATAQLFLAVLARADPPPRRVDELVWLPGAAGWLGHGR